VLVLVVRLVERNKGGVADEKLLLSEKRKRLHEKATLHHRAVERSKSSVNENSIDVTVPPSNKQRPIAAALNTKATRTATRGHQRAHTGASL
jgi:hypothetical protein